MHSLLEQYLNEVARYLRVLPQSRRDEELRELRQHLVKLMSDGGEPSHTEGEAASAAIQHFGPPAKLGRQMVRAWCRGLLLGCRDSAIGTALLAGAALYLPTILAHILKPSHTIAPGVAVVPMVPLPLSILWSALIGGYVGWKMAARSTLVTVGTALCTAAAGTLLASFLGWPVDLRGQLPRLSLFLLEPRFIPILAQMLLYGWAFAALCALPGALVGRFWGRGRAALN